MHNNMHLHTSVSTTVSKDTEPSWFAFRVLLLFAGGSVRDNPLWGGGGGEKRLNEVRKT